MDLGGRVSGFVGAHVAHARLDLEAASSTEGGSLDDALWQRWGAVIRYAASTERNHGPVALRDAWDHLQRFSQRAVPQLVWIDQQINMWAIGGSRTFLRDTFAIEIKRLLETGLANRPLQCPRESWFINSAECGAISLLGIVGDSASRGLLAKLVDVPELGEAAVAAIRAIDAKPRPIP
jgi:hypothetical protein